MTRTLNKFFGVIALGLLLLLWLSSSVHPEALDVEKTIDKKFKSQCKEQRPKIYYSLPRGMLLIISDLGGGRAGGQIWKFTEHRFGELMPCDKIYESTCFAADQAYWCRVIKRDGYIHLSEAKWIVGTGLFIALGVLCQILRKKGRDDLANALGGDR